MNKIKFALILGAMSLLGSCKKFLDVNTNPNSPTDADPAFVVSQALVASANSHYAYYFALSQWMGYSARSQSFAPIITIETFQVTQATFQATWTGPYHIIYDLNFVEKKSRESDQPYFEGVAKTLKAYWFQYLVDMFNNIPYSEAAQPGEINNPKYDDAKTIYEDLVKELDEAITSFKTAPDLSPSDAKYDVLWQGDKTKWIKLANTIKLRMLIRQSEMTGRAAYIQSEITKIANEGTGFLDEGEDALINPGYQNSTGKMTPFYANLGFTANGSPAQSFLRAHQFAIDFYKNNNDPRLDQVYKKPANGIHLGNVLGASPNSNAITSEPGEGVYKTADAGFPFFLAAESLFLQAEAAQRGWLAADAKNLYQRAIAASFEYYGVSDATTEATTYYSQQGLANVNWDDSPDKIQVIVMQKWAALNGVNAMEAWTEFRRTGFPVITPASSAPSVPINSVPVRALYPQVEYDVNSVNVLSQGNISQFNSKTFWMR
jgi:hypothetical protein